MSNNQPIQYTKIGVLAIAHMLNDMYSNFLPQMFPFLVVLRADFTATRAAILVSAFSITSSMAQPVFGYYLDRQGKRWLVYVGTLWMAFMLSMTGIVQDYTLLAILAGLAGLGTAAFHPQASTMVNVLSGEHKAITVRVLCFWLSWFRLRTAAFGSLVPSLWIAGNPCYSDSWNSGRYLTVFFCSKQ